VNSPRGIRGVSPEEEKESCGGKDLPKRCVRQRQNERKYYYN